MAISNIQQDIYPKITEQTTDTYHEDKAALSELLKGTLYQVLGTHGTGNMHEAGSIMYDTLFSGEQDGTRRGTPQGIIRAIEQPGYLRPEKDQFVAWFRDKLVHDPMFQKACEFPGALASVESMMDAGPVIIWTEGDTLSPVNGSPGSGEQLEKIRGIGIFRRAVERALSTTAIHHDVWDKEELESTTNSIVEVEASESKFSQASIQRVVDHLRKQDVRRVVVLEDRLNNAARMQQILADRGFSTTGIWVKQGRHGRKAGEHDDTVVEADNIVTAGQIVREIRAETGEPIGIVSDLDGVIADQERREQLQAEVLYEGILNQDWAHQGTAPERPIEPTAHERDSIADACYRDIISDPILERVSAGERQEIADNVFELYTKAREHVAPAIVGFADSLLKEAGETKQVIFAARDGLGPYNAARALLEKFPEQYSVDKDDLVYAYLTRKIVQNSSPDKLRQYLNGLGVDCSAPATLADIGMYGSIVPRIESTIPHLATRYIISRNPSIPGYIDGPGASSSMRSLETIIGNPAVHFLEDTFSGETASPSQLVVSEGRVIPELDSHAYGPEELLKRKYVQRAFGDYVDLLDTPPSQREHDIAARAAVLDDFLLDTEQYRHLMVPHSR